jgi:hypothetical protein
MNKNLVLAALLAIPLMSIATAARGKLISPCLSTASSAGGVLLVCPAGDGPTLAEVGATISVTVMDPSGNPVPYVYPGDFWIDGTPFGTRTCRGSYSSAADGYPDASGYTTMSGSIAAGGYCVGVYVIAEGIAIQYGDCDNPLPVTLVSPDINNDQVVDSEDFALFAVAYEGGGTTVDPRMDFNGDGTIDSLDFTMFGNHYLHVCSQ